MSLSVTYHPVSCVRIMALTIPSTFTAYKPGLYPSSLCHFATQLPSGPFSVIMPSKTWLVQSSTVSWLPRISRKSSQFGQPCDVNLEPAWITEQTIQARIERMDDIVMMWLLERVGGDARVFLKTLLAVQTIRQVASLRLTLLTDCSIQSICKHASSRGRVRRGGNRPAQGSARVATEGPSIFKLLDRRLRALTSAEEHKITLESHSHRSLGFQPRYD